MDLRPGKTSYYILNAVGLVMFGYNLWYEVNYLLQEYSPSHYVTTPGVVNIVTVNYSEIGFTLFVLLATLFFLGSLLFGGKIIQRTKLKIWLFVTDIVLIALLIAYYVWVFIMLEFFWHW